MIFLDIKKAFNTVNHDILLQKMKSYGISGPELEFFNSYLKNRVQHFNINGQTSDFRKRSCVSQGSILGYILYVIYMNNLPNSVKNAKTVMFADDTSLSRSFKSISELNIQSIPALANTCKWLKQIN